MRLIPAVRRSSRVPESRLLKDYGTCEFPEYDVVRMRFGG